MPDPRADQPFQPTTTPPPGWYPDPTAPAGRTGRRWWTGTGWSEHVVADPAGLARTPDGATIAGMGPRLGAYLIDGLVTGLVSTLVGLPFLLSLLRAAADQFGRSMDAARAGTTPPSAFSPYDEATGAFLGFVAVGVLVSVLYHVLFLRFRSATPGKLLVGLRVRTWDHPGRLTWGTILRRLAAQFWYVLLTPVPVVGTLLGLYALGDNLSALGNTERRTLHDRAAGTVVVRAQSTV